MLGWDKFVAIFEGMRKYYTCDVGKSNDNIVA